MFHLHVDKKLHTKYGEYCKKVISYYNEWESQKEFSFFISGGILRNWLAYLKIRKSLQNPRNVSRSIIAAIIIRARRLQCLKIVSLWLKYGEQINRKKKEWRLHIHRIKEIFYVIWVVHSFVIKNTSRRVYLYLNLINVSLNIRRQKNLIHSSLLGCSKIIRHIAKLLSSQICLTYNIFQCFWCTIVKPSLTSV